MPNTTKNTFEFGPVGACSPPVGSDPGCGFEMGADKRGGQVLLKLKGAPGGTLSFKVKIKGIDPGCEGETLRLEARVRKTTASTCADGMECTLADLDYDFDTAIAAIPGSKGS